MMGAAAEYQAVAKVTKATATRRLADLAAKGCLEMLPGSHSIRYQIVWSATDVPTPLPPPEVP